MGGKLSRTSLMMAIELNHYRTVEKLLEYDPDLSVKDNYQQQVLHIVAQQGNVETAKVCLFNYIKTNF